MSTIQFKDKLRGYGEWREQLSQAVEQYRAWLDRYQLNSEGVNETISTMLEGLRSDRIILAFAAEFSRGKTELINALFFSDTGVRLLPSSPGRTTMCPTEIFYDATGGSYIRLLGIESRLSDTPLTDYKKHPRSWMQIDLDCDSPVQMQEAFQELAATKQVSVAEARKLGLYSEDMHMPHGDEPDTVEVPCWRHALISFPHHLLKEGLTILDTPGLNALGAEPELTLQMLPKAQAVIFVLAADTGVTKSDLDMWRNHVRGSRQGNKKSGLAVVLNKIDSMWGDLQGEETIEKSIRSQTESVGKILEVDNKVIFPMSAKQALLAKVKGDKALLEKSRLKSFEEYLAESVVKERQNLVVGSIAQGVGHLVSESSSALEAQVLDAERQITDLRQIDITNKSKLSQLMTETRGQQSSYLVGVDQFQASRRVFAVQAKLLVDSLAPEKVEEIVRRTRKQMAGSLTTVGMKGAMRSVLDELRSVLLNAVTVCEETRKLVRGIYAKFQEEHGVAELKPPLLSLKQYQAELEQVFDEGESFRTSASSTLMEQSTVVVKLYTTTVARARELFEQAHKDAIGWTTMALVPLVHQIKDHKRLIESRLEVLRKVNETGASLDGEIATLVKSLNLLRHQYSELVEIKKGLQIDEKEGEGDPQSQDYRPPRAMVS
ncbi:dynamin family protein [Methylomagnum sp.]